MHLDAGATGRDGAVGGGGQARIRREQLSQLWVLGPFGWGRVYEYSAAL